MKNEQLPSVHKSHHNCTEVDENVKDIKETLSQMKKRDDILWEICKGVAWGILVAALKDLIYKFVFTPIYDCCVKRNDNNYIEINRDNYESDVKINQENDKGDVEINQDVSLDGQGDYFK